MLARVGGSSPGYRDDVDFQKDLGVREAVDDEVGAAGMHSLEVPAAGVDDRRARAEVLP